MKKTLFSIFFSTAYLFTAAQTWQDTVLQIEKIFARYKPANPGTQLAISRHGTIIFSKAWGMSSLLQLIKMDLTHPPALYILKGK